MLYRMTLEFLDTGMKQDFFIKNAPIKTLYQTGCTTVRTARRHNYQLALTIRNEHTGENLFRFYHRKFLGDYYTRLSGGCLYGGQNHKGLNL